VKKEEKNAGGVERGEAKEPAVKSSRVNYSETETI